jgi:hypothetical protein
MIEIQQDAKKLHDGSRRSIHHNGLQNGGKIDS